MTINKLFTQSKTERNSKRRNDRSETNLFEEVMFDVELDQISDNNIESIDMLVEEFPEEKTILLKNFDQKITIEDLRRFFSNVGRISNSCSFIDKYSGVIRFIYIEFNSVEEKLQAKLLNQTMLFGKLIKIEEKRNIPYSLVRINTNSSIKTWSNVKSNVINKECDKFFQPY